MTKEEILKMLKAGQTPQQIVMNYLQNNSSNNPTLSNLLTLAQEGKQADVEQIARNLAQQRGIDYDKAFSEFQSFLGILTKR